MPLRTKGMGSASAQMEIRHLLQSSRRGQSNSKGFCNPKILDDGNVISGMVQTATIQKVNATIDSNGVCHYGTPQFPTASWTCECPPPSCAGCIACEKCVNNKCVNSCTGNCSTCGVDGVCEGSAEACSGCAVCSGSSNNFNCEADSEDCGNCGTCTVTGTDGTCSGLGDEACAGCLACTSDGGKYNCQPDDGYCDPGDKCCPGGDCDPGKCTVCPIVLDAFNEGYHLTSLASGVRFTVLPGGPLQQMSWTDANWRNGWLALDRNGDGTIDDFTELFGNYTAQPPSNTPNGFLALAVFDNPANGGNGNGFIDPGDAVYSHLWVWIDSNHNGVISGKRHAHCVHQRSSRWRSGECRKVARNDCGGAQRRRSTSRNPTSGRHAVSLATAKFIL
jgi:hypothetical protein